MFARGLILLFDIDVHLYCNLLKDLITFSVTNAALLLSLLYAIFCIQLQHPLIAEFPSRHFYDGKLTTAPDHECRGIRLLNIWRRNVPLMFCHVEGAEKALTVSTAEGSEQSKSNDAERDEAVSIHLELMESQKHRCTWLFPEAQAW